MRLWSIYCSDPMSGPPALFATADDRDGFDALSSYHGGGMNGLLAMASLPHEAYEVQPHELFMPGFELAPTLQCPHSQQLALREGNAK